MSSNQSIKLETETEHLLFRIYSEQKTNSETLESLVNDLRGQIEELQHQLKQIQEKTKTSDEKLTNNENPMSEVTYETDEEELARETEWIRQKSRKKRKLNSTLSPQQGADSNEQTKAKQHVKKPPLPPPIVVENVKDYQKFYDLLLTSLTGDLFIAKMLNGKSVKINANNADTYKTLTKLLTENNFLWYSYENKQDRPIRVMAKNLHSSCLPNRIVEHLALQGYKIQDAANKLNWRNKEPLNMFMLSFQKDEDINKIYSIKSILGCKVDIQPWKTSKLIPQCKRCQAYGHTQKYCCKEPRCVKCTGKHLTKDCKKSVETKAKCVHCGEPHPANYRGCSVAKELQNMKNKMTKKNVTAPTAQVPSTNKKPSAHKHTTNNVTYAQVTKGSQPRPQPQSNSNLDEKINTILSLVTSFDERLKKLECSNKTATMKRKQ